MSQPFPSALAQRIRTTGVIAVLMIDDAEHAVPVARALLEGGVDCMELTLRTPAAEACIAAIRAKVPEMKIGAGTVLSVEQVDRVIELGASFAVSPGLNPKVVRRAQERGLPFAPGVMTPTDVEAAMDLGCKVLKFFPASVAGGAAWLKAIYGPIPQANFCPTGGIRDDDIPGYLACTNLAAFGSSAVASRALIAERKWDEITARAKQLMAVVRAHRPL